MAASAPVELAGVHLEDREIIEQLVKLRGMYDQLLDLRELLPERLMIPLRSAFANPQRISPQQIAAHMRKVVQDGTNQLDAFSNQWHDEDMRSLWLKANTTELPQGQDTWNIDYKAIAKAMNEGNLASQVQKGSGDANEIEMDEVAGDIVKVFSENHKNVRIKVSNDDQIFPNEVIVAELEFGIETTGEPHSAGFKVILRKEYEASSLGRAIVAELEKIQQPQKLSSILEHLAAYHDIKTRECSKCQRLFDDDLLLPLIRSHPAKDTIPNHWQAFHVRCAPSP